MTYPAEELDELERKHAWIRFAIVMAGIISCFAVFIPVAVYKVSHDDQYIYKQEVGILKKISYSATYQPRERKTLNVGLAHVIVDMDVAHIPYPQIQSLLNSETNKRYRLTYKSNGTGTYIFVSFYRDEP